MAMGQMWEIDPRNFMVSTFSTTDGECWVYVYYMLRRIQKPPEKDELEEMKPMLPILHERIGREMRCILQELEKERMDELERRGDPLYALSMQMPSLEFSMHTVDWDDVSMVIFTAGKACFQHVKTMELIPKVNGLGYRDGFFSPTVS